ncbi:MAG: hypothetical protein COW32_06245 [Candidatus Aquicultor secundus]|uniref:J domain-containing protein n=1 Tax=Candidatus Aquicultor secundus TaxID=1973895 RepID=A0A2M7T613_9ACTN|nr:DnaJ domain-containing protein [Candidatus Aquicultor secundus]NCO65418.1 J domain-containing protein [Solirubrobacter sp.]OIO86502.1 MAG: hypothetical protein AUK32_05475 [Candidatus Aquicultor secundus]PIU26439.1 MAG: hypothetical protein COT10_08665 [Candidatus Aquicultor secundus]PIW22122.1 MAG: hypothetical protein COW32_06245 [Candidatus Aquicultor secundus]PIX52422.1 MAG: hypothetical protein COZ51_04240 [Candidatus Aquicultor secundus]
MVDYYKILEVDPEASKEVIDKAYRALSLKYHPDKHPDEHKEAATRKWLEIRKAYEVISNDKERAAYNDIRKRETIDLFLNEGLLGLVRKYLKNT